MAELTLSDGTRSLELIGTGSTGIWLKQDGLNLPVVGKELTYAESADSEGRRRIRSKPQNAEGSFSVFISHPTDATFWGYVDNLQELVESAHENKGTLTYTPPDGTQVTFDLESIQVTGLPQSGVSLRNNLAEVDVSFECLPYGRLPEQRMNFGASYAEAVTALSPSIFLPLAGSAPLTDLSPNGRNGTAEGDVTAGGYTPGPLAADDSGATDFDGTDDYLRTYYKTRRNWELRPTTTATRTAGNGSPYQSTVASVYDDSVVNGLASSNGWWTELTQTAAGDPQFGLLGTAIRATYLDTVTVSALVDGDFAGDCSLTYSVNSDLTVIDYLSKAYTGAEVNGRRRVSFTLNLAAYPSVTQVTPLIFAPSSVVGTKFRVTDVLVEKEPSLIRNPGLEVNTDLWSAIGGGSISRTTAEKKHGAASLDVTTAGVGSGAGAYADGVTPGKPYRAKAWLKGVGSGVGTVRMILAAHDKNDAYLGDVFTDHETTGGWVQYTTPTYTMPAGAYRVRIIFSYQETYVTTFWVDTQEIEEVDKAPGEFFPTPDQLTNGEAGYVTRQNYARNPTLTNDSSGYGEWQGITGSPYRDYNTGHGTVSNYVWYGVTQGSTTSEGIFYQSEGVPPGEMIFSAHVTGYGNLELVAFHYTDDWSAVVASKSVALTDVVKTRISVPLEIVPQAGATAGKFAFVFVTIDAHVTGLYMGDVMIEKAGEQCGRYDSQYGFFPTPAQLSSGAAGWDGTVHGSTSFLTGEDHTPVEIGPFANGASRSYLFWLKRDDTSATARVALANQAQNRFDIVGQFIGSTVSVYGDRGVGSFLNWTGLPTDTDWHHYAFVFDREAAKARLYVDGVLSGSEQGYTTQYQWAGAWASHSGTGVPDSDPTLLIGRYGAGQSMDGKMAWVSVHQRGLTADEILTAYNAGKAQVNLTGPIDSFTVPDIPGQVPALGELTLTDTSTQTRNHVEVGVQHDYDSSAIEPIQLNAVTDIDGLAGASNTRAGSIATNILRAGLVTSAVAVCVAEDQPHAGRWKVRARLWPSATSTRVRLAWRTGNAPFTREKWVTIPGEDAWFEVDLGTVNIAELTTHTVDFRLEARASSGNPTLDVDVLYLIPADNYSRLRGDTSQDVPVAAVVAADNFGSHSAGNLTGKTADIGGAWSGAGDAVDIAVASGLASRSESSDTAWAGRYLTLGGTVTACTVSADILVAADNLQKRTTGILLRYGGTSDWLMAHLQDKHPLFWRVGLTKRVGGTVTQIGFADLGHNPEGIYSTLSASVTAAGAVSVYCGPADGAQSLYISTTDSSLATSAALEDGTVGIYDEDQSTLGLQPTRFFDNFLAVSDASGATIANPAINSGQSLTLTHEAAWTENAAGDGEGLTPIREGQYLKLPPETRNSSVSRIAVKARRRDGDEGFADTGTADTLTATLSVTPRVHLLGP